MLLPVRAEVPLQKVTWPEAPVPVWQAVPLFERRPLAAIETQPAVPPPAPRKSCEVEAAPVTVSEDEVALVEKRLVEEAVAAKVEPVVVPFPLTKKLPARESLWFGVDEPMPKKPEASKVTAEMVEVAKVWGLVVAM